MEARRSLASYGVSDACSCMVPTRGRRRSALAGAMGHRAALDEIVRLIRVTRPEVILTWMPKLCGRGEPRRPSAAGVLATEAFESSANPLAFLRGRSSARTAGHRQLRRGTPPLAAEENYYFSDTTHFDFLHGKGPEYQTNDMSPSRKVPYSRVAAEAWNYYKTQNDFTDAQLKEFTECPSGSFLENLLWAGVRPAMSSKASRRRRSPTLGHVATFPLRRDSNWNSVGPGLLPCILAGSQYRAP